MTLDQKALDAAWRAAFPHHPVEPNRMEDLTAGIEAYLAASRSSAIVEEPMAVAWAFCPECGCEEIYHEEGRHKQCANCGQEWFDDIDYRDVCAKNLRRLFASPQPHTGRAGVTDEMVEVLALLDKFVPAYEAWMDRYADDKPSSIYRTGSFNQIRRARELIALNAALTVELVAPTKDEIRNEIARREEAGVDARVPLTGPANWSDADLRSAIAP